MFQWLWGNTLDIGMEVSAVLVVVTGQYQIRAPVTPASCHHLLHPQPAAFSNIYKLSKHNVVTSDARGVNNKIHTVCTVYAINY